MEKNGKIENGALKWIYPSTHPSLNIYETPSKKEKHQLNSRCCVRNWTFENKYYWEW
jgi:hypothetical protein